MLPQLEDYKIVLCIILLLHKASATTDQTVYVKEGHSVSLSCPGNPVVLWNDVKTGEVIARCIPDPVLNLLFADRLSLDNLCRIKIDNFASGDMRTFLCATDGINSYHIKVLLQAPPSEIHVLEADSNGIIYGAEGRNVTMTCKVKSGNTPETMFWIVAQNIVRAGGTSTLEYKFVAGAKNNMQEYTCFVNTTYDDEPISCTVTLKLIEKPKDVWILIEPITPVKRGQHVELTCLHTAKDVNNYAWNYNGEEMPDHNQTMVINTVMPSNIGNYTCSVFNIAGEGSGSTFLTMATHPIVHNYSITFNGTDMRRLLTCKVSGEPTEYTFKQWCHYTFSGELLRKLDSTDDGRLLLPTETDQGIRFEDSGKYVCNVTNGIQDEHGRLWQSGEIIVLIKGKNMYIK